MTHPSGSQNVWRGREWIIKNWRLFLVITLVAAGLAGGAAFRANAETYPGGTDNGLTSRLVSLSNTLSGLGYGSTTNTPDWGQYWNRISTAAQWTPSGNAVASDVKSGKTFYNNSRSQQTGTYPAASSCPTENYDDTTAPTHATQATNCTATWTTPSDGIAGTDKQDARTGVIWSQALANSSGTIIFTTGTPTTSFSSDSSGGSNTSKTAAQLCTLMGNGWRLPTQKELLQAYIDGSYFSLTNPAYTYLSNTLGLYYGNPIVPWVINLNNGVGATTFSNNSYYAIRCVR